MASMENNCDSPHFIANFRVREDYEAEPKGEGFIFPKNGVRQVPTQIDESISRATIGIFHEPNCTVPNGGSFSAPCKVLSEEYWAGFIKKGLKFSIWGCKSAVDATVTEIFPENWSEVDFKNRWMTILYDELKELINQDLKKCTPEQLNVWEKYSINPVKAEINRYGETEFVFLVAVKDNEGMYYEDVEEGFNFSPLDDGRYKILEHWCNQDNLPIALNRWVKGAQFHGLSRAPARKLE